MTVYIDIIFLENVFMNSIILFATATILKIPIKIIRILVSSIIRECICNYNLYIKFANLFKLIFKNSIISSNGICCIQTTKN